MKTINWANAIVVAVCLNLAFTLAANAHHSISPHYDRSKPVTFSGVVTDFRFVNPHSFLYVDVEAEDGSIDNWACEMQAAVILRHSGWNKDLFKQGDRVTITGSSARRDAHGCGFSGAVFADGTRVQRDGTIVRVSGEATAPTGNNEAIAVEGDATIYGRWRTARHLRPGGDLAGDLVAVPAGQEQPSAEDIGTEDNPLGLYASFLSEQGLAAAANYDLVYDDPALECSGASIMRAWTEPNGISEITRRESQIVIKHQYMDVVRTVHLDESEHPEEIEPSMVGHSIGWFEDDELVIDTIGFEAGVLFPHPGILHSDQLHVIERLSLSEDGSQLIREYVATDPIYFSKPMPGRVVWNRSDRPLLKFDCVELSGKNNERPSD